MKKRKKPTSVVSITSPSKDDGSLFKTKAAHYKP